MMSQKSEKEERRGNKIFDQLKESFFRAINLAVYDRGGIHILELEAGESGEKHNKSFQRYGEKSFVTMIQLPVTDGEFLQAGMPRSEEYSVKAAMLISMAAQQNRIELRKHGPIAVEETHTAIQVWAELIFKAGMEYGRQLELEKKKEKKNR